VYSSRKRGEQNTRGEQRQSRSTPTLFVSGVGAAPLPQSLLRPNSAWLGSYQC
jgi:hypothetical protein